MPLMGPPTLGCTDSPSTASAFSRRNCYCFRSHASCFVCCAGEFCSTNISTLTFDERRYAHRHWLVILCRLFALTRLTFPSTRTVASVVSRRLPCPITSTVKHRKQQERTLFGLFKSPQFTDPQLGELVRSRGLWRGSLAVPPSSQVPLALSGTRSEPDVLALAAAHEVVAVFASWRSAIEKALFEHLEPYVQAVAAGELRLPSEGLPKVASPADVWSHVSLIFVSVTPLAGTLTTELGYTTAWDEEHTLAARFQSGRFIELCGSVLPP